MASALTVNVQCLAPRAAHPGPGRRCTQPTRQLCIGNRMPQQRWAFADDVLGMRRSGGFRAATTARAAASGGGGPSGGGGSSSGGGGGGGSGGASGDGSSQPHPMQTLTYAFAALLAAGGVFAFAKKGSAKSMGAGLGAALILALCARSMAGAPALSSARVAFALCTMLGIVMASRFNNSKKFMPAGLLALLSLSMAGGFAFVGL